MSDIIVNIKSSAKKKLLTAGKICNKDIVINVESIVSAYAMNKLTTLTDKDLSGCTKIREHAFSSCSSLTSITIPDSVTSIGDSAFSGCDGLESITIPDSVTSIGSSTFIACRNLEYINIPDSVTDISFSAFKNCTSLTSITIPGSVTRIGKQAFNNCMSLQSVTVNNGVTCIEDSAFDDCTSLTSITIPDSVTLISSAFQGCTSLTSITIPFVGVAKDTTSDRQYHFGYIFGAYEYLDNSDCVPTSLKTVIITGGSTIRTYAFYYCESLESITIPDSMTYISGGAFYGCKALRTLVIKGDSVKSLTYAGLNDTLIPSVLGSIYIESTSEDVDLDALVAEYKSATNWSTYADQIKPITEYTGV